jgi:1-acyl-sn-glycerol-3-phosphate acyltransferase
MRRFTSLIRVLLALTWTGLTALPFLPILVLLLPWRYARVVVAAVYGKIFCGPSLAIFGIRPVYEGLEHLRANPRAVYVTNHASNVDPFIGMWMNPIGNVGVAKREVVWIPVFGQMYFLSGHLLINRSDARGAVAALNDTAAVAAKHGVGMWIWPEGTQPRDGRLLAFKKGFVHLAIATGLPVIPVVAHDAHLRWPARSLDIRPGPLRIQILPPISTADWSPDTAQDHADAVHDVFARALSPHQRPLDASHSAPG